MHVLVTGDAGFIGSHLTERLLSADDRVRILDNLSTGERENLPYHPGLEFVEGDIRDASLAGRCMKGVGAVVHLAAVQIAHSHDVVERVRAACPVCEVSLAASGGDNRCYRVSFDKTLVRCRVSVAAGMRAWGEGRSTARAV